MIIRFKQNDIPQTLEALIRSKFPDFTFKVGGIYIIKLLTGALLLSEDTTDSKSNKFIFDKINGEFLYIKETSNLYVSTYNCKVASINVQIG